ncbi:glycosyltransferase family 4 protein [Altibacter lentus]|uniref:glycosyltransferase family 4 protein n=1 Tax=Altibacter lentus TaxID=1223410 RepID=UPI000558754D|nr:glycosyltransferase family 4 protein [Altibacter lentus]
MRILQIHNTYHFDGGEDTVVENEYAILKSHGVEVERLFFDNTSVNPLQLIYNTSSAKILQKKLEVFKPDLIHVHNLFYKATPSILYVAKRQGIPVVMTLHNYRLICPNAMFLRDHKVCIKCKNKTFPFPAIQHKCFKDSYLKSATLSASLFAHNVFGTWAATVDKFIVLTPFAKKMITSSALRVEPDKIAVKPNSTDGTSHAIIPPEERDGYVFVGRLSEEKGVEVLIDAFNELPHLKLFILGTGELELKLKARANTTIQFMGQQPASVVREKVRHAKALVFSSIIFEGLPNTIIEAFSAGTPVIASNIDNINSIVDDGLDGQLFQVSNSEDLRKTIQYFEQNNALKYYENARRKFEAKYTHEKNYTSLMHIYKEVLATHEAENN